MLQFNYGFSELDKATGGVRQSETINILGEAHIGVSRLLVDLVYKALTNNKKVYLVMSDYTNEQIMDLLKLRHVSEQYTQEEDKTEYINNVKILKTKNILKSDLHESFNTLLSNLEINTEVESKERKELLERGNLEDNFKYDIVVIHNFFNTDLDYRKVKYNFKMYNITGIFSLTVSMRLLESCQTVKPKDFSKIYSEGLRTILQNSADTTQLVLEKPSFKSGLRDSEEGVLHLNHYTDLFGNCRRTVIKMDENFNFMDV